ncbi:unnamed protein product [Strongylus vulgaris]|uniref:Uncharacterized protein n=1 Tax=Strongylus vulgaris TaxID=40348 RepID=A0A3P7IKZ1_STRVU|nr:unnamed protein product [Strongylus vulgaris]
MEVWKFLDTSFFAEANQLVQSFAGESRSDEDKNYEQTIAQLKDEIQILKTRLADETASKERAATAKDPAVEDLEKKVRELKEKNRQLILEKAELQRVSDSLKASGDLPDFVPDERERGSVLQRTLSRGGGAGECAPPDPLAARPTAPQCCCNCASSSDSEIVRKRSGDNEVPSNSTGRRAHKPQRRERSHRRAYFLWMLFCLGFSFLYRYSYVGIGETIEYSQVLARELWGWAREICQHGVRFVFSQWMWLFPGTAIVGEVGRACEASS